MKSSIEEKLKKLSAHHEALGAQLSQPEVIADQERFKTLSKEYAKLEPVVETFRVYQENEARLAEARQLLEDPDVSMRALAESEIHHLEERKEQLEHSLHVLLLPEDPDDQRNVFLEIRAAAGGSEAALFAGDLFNMYHRFAEAQKWQMEVVSESGGEHGGFKAIICRIIGQAVYEKLKFESGAHRVQRVPETEAQGRIHTSTCTVAVMPEIEEVEAIEINPAELRIDTFRASGAGGQHVNKTDSAIRITHLPTGTVVECQEERSQHKNRAKALSLLKAKLLDQERMKQQKEQAATRRSLVGTGDRSERIRTYNFPQGRITDHRINLTLYKLEEVMLGNLLPVINPLIQEYQAERLSALGNE